MSSNKTLGDIPVVVEGGAPEPDKHTPARSSLKLHWQRRGFQWSVLLLSLLIPLSGLFRIDPIQGAFVILDRQIWFSDFGIVFGFWVAVACLLAMMYSVLGTAFCGWACPQNTLSEWANGLTYKLLGRRADVSLDGSPMKVANAKNTFVNWSILVLLCLLMSLAIALIPLFYFYEPHLIWKFMTLRYDPGLAPSLHWIYMVFVLILFVDLLMIRHFMCRFMCIYKVWQHTFKTKQTLHIAYDQARAQECEKCNYCVSSCFLAIDPRKTDVYDTCINCGECITACDALQVRKKGGGAGLLKFAFGERVGQNFEYFKTNVNSLFGRVRWSFPIFLLGLVMFVWGLLTWEAHHVSVYRADTLQGSHIQDYRISIANKFYHEANLSLSVEGLPEGSYRLAQSEVLFDTAKRINVELNISRDLPAGLHPFLVRVKSPDGWEEAFRVHHVATAGGV